MGPADKWSVLRPSIRRVAGITAAIGTYRAVSAVANTALITYTMSGVGDGSLGPINFSGAIFAVTVAADTAAVRALAPGVPCVDAVSATFTIGDVASGSITTPVSVADNASWQLMALSRGGCRGPNPMWLVGFDPQFGSYDLVSELGPVPLTMPGAPDEISVDTSQGVLVFRNISALSLHAQCPDVLAQQVQSKEATAVPTVSKGGFGPLTVVLAGIGTIAPRPRGTDLSRAKRRGRLAKQSALGSSAQKVV